MSVLGQSHFWSWWEHQVPSGHSRWGQFRTTACVAYLQAGLDSVKDKHQLQTTYVPNKNLLAFWPVLRSSHTIYKVPIKVLGYRGWSCVRNTLPQYTINNQFMPLKASQFPCNKTAFEQFSPQQALLSLSTYGPEWNRQRDRQHHCITQPITGRATYHWILTQEKHDRQFNCREKSLVGNVNYSSSNRRSDGHEDIISRHSKDPHQSLFELGRNKLVDFNLATYPENRDS